jgi:uncharacterized protein YegJ (DUF2314 family)
MSEKKPIIGITLLLSKPKAIDLQGVTQAAEFAFHGAPEKPKVMQMPGKPAFGIALGPLRLVVINVGQAYFTEVGKVANRLSSVSARDAVQSHKAWLSVDATGVSPLPEELLIPTLGLLAAEFCDDTVLGLMRLPKGPVVGYDFSFISLLRNRKALEMFKNGPPDRVVRASVEISDFLEAAAGEARRRWPEFMQAFEKRKPGYGFGVKKAFVVGGDIEHMWVEVGLISGNMISGNLANAPSIIKSMKLKQKVELSVEEVEDWLYVTDTQRVGGFQAAVFNKHRQG